MLCEKFQWERQELLSRIGDIKGSDAWLEGFVGADNVGKMIQMLGRRVAGLEWRRLMHDLISKDGGRGGKS